MPSIFSFGPGISFGDLLTSIDFLGFSVAGWGQSGEPSSLQWRIGCVSGENELSHGSVAHHSINHTLEFWGKIFSLGKGFDVQIDLRDLVLGCCIHADRETNSKQTKNFKVHFNNYNNSFVGFIRYFEPTKSDKINWHSQLSQIINFGGIPLRQPGEWLN